MAKWNIEKREAKDLVVHKDGRVEERNMQHLFDDINGAPVDYQEVVGYRFEESEREGLGRALYWNYEEAPKAKGRRKRKMQSVYYYSEAQLRASEERGSD